MPMLIEPDNPDMKARDSATAGGMARARAEGAISLPKVYG
jgi:hypothetical protein